MFVTTQGEYGLRCMVALAVGARQTVLSLRQLAESERISKDYIGKILHRLKKAGLVQSAHGSRGGYRLARPACEITVKEVFMAAERGSLKNALSENGDSATAARRQRNPLHPVWREVYEAAFGVMDRVNLEMLCPGSKSQEAGA